MNISDKAIAIAVRTFFCDAHDKEQVIYLWLSLATNDYKDCPFTVWSEVEHLSPASLYCLVDNLAGDIIGSYMETLDKEVRELREEVNNLQIANACYEDEHIELEQLRSIIHG